MTHIYHGKYKLYLNHCVCNLAENKIKLIILLDGVALYESKYPSKEQVNKCREVHSEQEQIIKQKNNKEEYKVEKIELQSPLFLNKGIKGSEDKKYYNKDNNLYKEFIMDINIVYNEKIDNSSGHELVIKFDQKGGSWKEGWFIDGVILKKEL